MQAKRKTKVVTAPRMDKAKGYIDRAKAILIEQRAYGVDLTEICKEAKENDGLDPSMIRFAAREALIDEEVRRERDDKRAQYLHALGLAVAAVESGALSARQSAKLYSIGKTSIYKELSVRAVSADHREMLADDLGEWLPPHDAETGEIHETALDTPPLREREFEVASRPCSIMPAPEAWQGITRAFIEAEERRRVEREAAKERRRAEREAIAARNRRIDADDLAIPDFLKQPLPARMRAATDEELRAQRESWVRGEMAIGNDRDEAEYRAALRRKTAAEAA